MTDLTQTMTGPSADENVDGGGDPARHWRQVLRSVERRLLWRGFWQRMLGSAPLVAVALALLVAQHLMTGSMESVGLGLALLMLWPVAALVMAALTGCRGFDALAEWDRATRRREEFASAYWFDTSGDGSVGARLHSMRARRECVGALQGLKQDLPLPGNRRRVFWVLLVALGFLLPGRGGVNVVGEPGLTDAMRAVAAERAQSLRQRQLGLDRLPGLEDREREALRELEQRLQELANDLDQVNGGARELLQTLEQQAGAAEELARQFRGDGEAWAGDHLLAEMQRHADTADLADLLREQDAGRAADEAERLAQMMATDDLASATLERLTATMRDLAGEVRPEDAERLAGQHLARATSEFEREPRPTEASTHMEALADDLRETGQRQQVGDRLQQLASELREAGSEILGGGARELQRADGGDRSSADAGASAVGTGAEDGAQGSDRQSSAEGDSEGQGGDAGSGGNDQGAPQTGAGDAAAGSPPSAPGQADGGTQSGSSQESAAGDASGASAPSLFAPIPGQGGDGVQAGAAGQTRDKGQTGTVGVAAQVPGSDGQEGSDAPGAGSAPLVRDEQGPAGGDFRDETVVVDPAGLGDSSVRDVQGQPREEQPQRDAGALSVDRIDAEEQALDDMTLPLSRRQEVRRYFEAIRERFE